MRWSQVDEKTWIGDSESPAHELASRIRSAQLPEIADVVSAYHKIAITFDSAAPELDWLVQKFENLPEVTANSKTHRIPVCYEMGADIDSVCGRLEITLSQLIAFHSGVPYEVVAIGFVPGFPYLGYLPAEISGLPRLPSPRTRVEPGSVGITGNQSGIYPSASPGGWNLIGRTPLVIVDVSSGYFPIQAGDKVQFDPISAAGFEELSGERL